MAVDTTGDRAGVGSAGDGPPSSPRPANQPIRTKTPTTPGRRVIVAPGDIPMRPGGRLPLSVEVASYDWAVTIAIYGELDAATTLALRAVLDRLPDPQPKRLIFELAGLSFTDCAGARAIAGVGRRPLVASSSANGVRIIRHARPAVRRVFELLDLDIWLIASDLPAPRPRRRRNLATTAAATSQPAPPQPRNRLRSSKEGSQRRHDTEQRTRFVVTSMLASARGCSLSLGATRSAVGCTSSPTLLKGLT